MAHTYYGTFAGAIDNQTISPNYHNSNGGPVVAFAQATYVQNSGSSSYNSLQVSAERRARDITYLLCLYLCQIVGQRWRQVGPSRSISCIWSIDMGHEA